MNTPDIEITDIVNWQQVAVLIFLIAAVMVKWFVEYKSNLKAIKNSKAQHEEAQDQWKDIKFLLTVIAERYTPDLSKEQIRPFMDFVFNSGRLGLMEIFIDIYRIKTNTDKPDTTIKSIITNDIENLFGQDLQTLQSFSYRAKPINEYFEPSEAKDKLIEVIYEGVIRGKSHETIYNHIKQILDQSKIKIVNKILNNKS